MQYEQKDVLIGTSTSTSPPVPCARLQVPEVAPTKGLVLPTGWTSAHDQTLTVRIIEHVPAHGPRGAAFEQAKKRMKLLGLVKCVIEGCDTGAPIEYHHSYVEHAWQNGVDVAKLDRAFGLHLSDEDFAAWVQSEGNLEALCSVHHRTQLGVHVLPEPLWLAVRVWRDGLAPPAEVASPAT